jgi:hypothetical protein
VKKIPESKSSNLPLELNAELQAAIGQARENGDITSLELNGMNVEEFLQNLLSNDNVEIIDTYLNTDITQSLKKAQKAQDDEQIMELLDCERLPF